MTAPSESAAANPCAGSSAGPGDRDRFAAAGPDASSAYGLVLRDLGASAGGGRRSGTSAVPDVVQAEPYLFEGLFEGCFARDEASSGPAADAAGLSTPADPCGGMSMLDFHAVAKPLIPRIEVTDYIEMGRLAAQWAADPGSRPRDVAELRRQVTGIATVPERITSIAFAQSTPEHLVLALPATEMLEEGIERVTDPVGDCRYPLPQFYADHCRPGFGPVMTPLDMLFARVGDYAIAQCR
jgi:hypothetical protein